MLAKLRYGIDSELTLDLKADALVAHCDAPRGEPLDDLAAALRAALEQPLDFPPLARSVVPGDKVAIALDHAVPQGALLIAGIVDVLQAAGIEPCDITIVRTPADETDGAGDPRALLAADIRSQVHLRSHDPANRDELSYLAASASGKPIYLDRAICEADVVIPVVVARLSASLGDTGPAARVLSAFSDEHFTQRYRAPRLLDSARRREKLRALADEVNWLLGVLFAVEVVPGGGQDLLHIVAGRSDLVFARSQQLCEAAWSFRVPHRASVVVAAVEGDAGSQTWENLARALWAASQAVTSDGAIAVCTDLAAELGPGTQQLCNADDVEHVLREIGRERPVDSLVAAELAQAIERGPLYLISRLDDALLEDLGIAHVGSDAELARLVSRHDSCILLANAQHAVARPQKETDTNSNPKSESRSSDFLLNAETRP